MIDYILQVIGIAAFIMMMIWMMTGASILAGS